MIVQAEAFKCECGKLHFTSGIGSHTECSCGRRLWEPMWRAVRRARRA